MNQDWEKWGRDIRDIVEDAVESQDFRRLNDTISNTVNDAIFNLKENIRMGGRRPGFGPMPGPDFGPVPGADFGPFPGENQGRVKRRERTYARYQREDRLFERKTGTKVLGVLLAVFGWVFTVPCVLAFFTGLFQFLPAGPSGVQAAALAILAGFTIGGAWMIKTGTGLCKRVSRYKEYIRSLRCGAYCNISDMSERTGIPTKKIVKDLRKMIRDRWFLQGHLDEQETCLMVTDEAYQEYRNICRMREEQAAASTDEKEETQEQKSKEEQVIEKGKWYVKRIRECNDAIPGVEISRKIDRIELLVRRIFERVEQDPDTVDDIRKLMDYYLPTTVKLLEAYAQLDDQPQAGENIRQAKEEIEKTLDTLNTAFEKLLDSLFEDVAWDISSDISVLETMLAQEGLTEDGFKRKE